MSQEATPPPLIRQRNTTPYTFHVAETLQHPAYPVLPGEIAEFPALLDSWTPVDDEPEPSGEDTPAKSPSRKRAAAADTDKDGGEPQ